MALNEGHLVNDPAHWSEHNVAARQINTANLYDFENDFGAPTDGVTDCSTALQAAVTAILAAGSGTLRTRNRVYVLNQEIVFPVTPLSVASGAIEIVGPTAFDTVSFAPGYPTLWDVPAISSGTIFKASITPMAAPVQAATSTATSGGTLANGTYYYVVAATRLGCETVYSNERSQITTGTGISTVTVNWATVTNATGYKVYRGTAPGGENKLVATIGSGATVTFVDTGGAGTTATPLGLGNANASVFGTTGVVNNILFKLTNIVVRVPMNPSIHGIEGGWLLNMQLDNVLVDVGGSTGDTINPILQPTHGTVGIAWPGEGNGGHVNGRNVGVQGFAVATTHSEHCLLDNFTAFKCGVGMRIVDGYHASNHGRVSMYWNTIGLQAWNYDTAKPVARTQIAELDFEETNDPAAWFTTTAHVDDPTNKLRGTISYHRVIAGTGIVAWLKRNGAAYTDITYAGGFDRTIFDAIGFEGVASATVIPTSLAVCPPVQYTGTWGVTGTPTYQGYLSAVTNGNNLVGWDTGQDQVQLHTPLTVSPTVGNRFNTGVLLNLIDSSNWLAVAINSASVTVSKMDTAVQTTPATTARVTAPGDSFDLVVQNRAGRILVWINDVLTINYALTTGERSKFSAGKIHGLYAYNSGASYEDGGSRWKFLRIAEPGPFSPA